MAKNRFKRDDEDYENPGEVLTSVIPEPVEAVSVEEEPKEDTPVEEMAVEEKSAISKDLLANLIPKKKKPASGTYGFYLDSDVHDELVKLAKQNKTTKSKFLNTLLRRVLFDE